MIPNNGLNFENHLDNDEIIENNVDEEINSDIILNSEESNLDEKIVSEDEVSDNIVQESNPNALEDSSSSKNETVETNCLALTVRKDYNLSIVKNTILTTFRFSWKIAFSTLILNILKLFL